jgi:hypothetical protein
MIKTSEMTKDIFATGYPLGRNPVSKWIRPTAPTASVRSPSISDRRLDRFSSLGDSS